jgi:hypothetical protein
MKPADRLIVRLKNALTLFELSRTKSDASLAVLVRDAVEMFKVDCEHEAAAEAHDYAERRSEVMF